LERELITRWLRLDDWDDLIQETLNSFGLIIPTQKMVKDKIDEILTHIAAPTYPKIKIQLKTG
jgi:hypothetical protein